MITTHIPEYNFDDLFTVGKTAFRVFANRIGPGEEVHFDVWAVDIFTAFQTGIDLAMEHFETAAVKVEVEKRHD